MRRVEKEMGPARMQYEDGCLQKVDLLSAFFAKPDPWEQRTDTAVRGPNQ